VDSRIREKHIDRGSLRIRRRKILGNEQLPKLYCSRNIIRKKQIQKNEKAYVGIATHIKEWLRQNFIQRNWREKPLGKPEHTVNMILKRILTKQGWRVSIGSTWLTKVISGGFPCESGNEIGILETVENFLSTWANVSFSRHTLLSDVSYSVVSMYAPM
jgi:hypothetical protein